MHIRTAKAKPGAEADRFLDFVAALERSDNVVSQSHAFTFSSILRQGYGRQASAATLTGLPLKPEVQA
jgi:hypothetical protein